MTDFQAMQRIKELVELLNYHAKLYYENDAPVISDYEYDMMYGLYGFGYSRYTMDDWGFQTHFNSPVWAEVKAESKFGYVDSMVGDEDEFDEEVFEDPTKVNEFLLKEGVV